MLLDRWVEIFHQERDTQEQTVRVVKQGAAHETLGFSVHPNDLPRNVAQDQSLFVSRMRDNESCQVDVVQLKVLDFYENSHDSEFSSLGNRKRG